MGSLFFYAAVYSDGSYESGFCTAFRLENIRDHLGSENMVVFQAYNLDARLDKDIRDILIDTLLDFSLDIEGDSYEP